MLRAGKILNYISGSVPGRFESRWCGSVRFLLFLAYCGLSIGMTVSLWAQGQKQQRASDQPAPLSHNADQDNTRIEALERDMALVKYGMGIVRDASLALGGLATIGLVVFGFLSWRRESRLQENYRESQRLEQERYTKERWFYEMQAERSANQTANLSVQQLEMGTLQSKNIEALGHVLDVIARASDIRLRREEGHEQVESMLKSLRTGAERRYLHARDEADRLKDIKAAQWPTLPLDRLQVATSALIGYQLVDDFVKEEKSSNEASRHAALLQRLGVFAYYAEHNYERGISYLT